MLKNQRFGVEVEMTGITREKAAKLVAKVLGGFVGNAEHNCYMTRKITDNQYRTWKVMRDSSIDPERNDGTADYSDEYRVELVTPPLNYEDIETLQKVIRTLKEAGAKANTSCGIHIHVDGANHNAESMRRLAKFFEARQDLFYDALEIGGRANRWCKKTPTSFYEAIKAEGKNLDNEKMERIWYSSANDGAYGTYRGSIDHSHYNETRYHGLNLHAFFTKGTIEFRLFNGTMHAGKIKAYIQFCLGMSAWAIESKDNVSFRKHEGQTADQKVKTMKAILTRRFGLSGDEFKTCRLHLLRPLERAAGMRVRREDEAC